MCATISGQVAPLNLYPILELRLEGGDRDGEHADQHHLEWQLERGSHVQQSARDVQGGRQDQLGIPVPVRAVRVWTGRLTSSPRRDRFTPRSNSQKGPECTISCPSHLCHIQ